MKNKFVRGMLIYALVILTLGGIGLAVLWNYLQAYEDSRSLYVVSDFMDSLTVEKVIAGSEDLLSGLDLDIQSRASAEQVIRDACQEDFRAVKDPAASTENTLRYRICCGRQPIGSFTVMITDRGRFGLPHWSVTKTEFDLSYLRGQSVSLTVDARAEVRLEGKQLPERCRTATDIPSDLFAQFADVEGLPTQVTYTVENYLGTIQWQVLDQDGQDVTGQDYEAVFLKDNCPEKEAEHLKQTLETFVKRYIAFSGSTKSSARGNLANLRQMIVSGSPLYTRLASALDGLNFGQSIRDQLTELQYNHLIQLTEDLYFCDVTYLVDTTGKKGVVQTTNNMRLLVTTQDGGWKVQELSSY